MNIKIILYYLIILMFAINGGILLVQHQEFSFWWSVGLVNFGGWGGLLVYKLLNYLKED